MLSSMKTFLRATTPRVVLAVSLLVLLMGGVVASASAHLATFDRSSVAQGAQGRRAALTTTRAQQAAAAHLTAQAAGTVLVAAGAADLDAAVGKVDQASRAALAGALERLRTAVKAGTDREISAASTIVVRAGQVVRGAAAAHDAEQTRIATQAAAARTAAAASAAQAAAQAAAAAAAQAQAARTAALGDAARASAIAQAAQTAAAAVPMIDIVGTISGTGAQLTGAPGSTFEANRTTGQCHLLGADADIATGTNVTVDDDHSVIVGTGTLAAGKTTSIQPTVDGYAGTCQFGFTVAVPDGNSFQVEVAHRGKVAVSRTNAGAVSLSLGTSTAATQG